MRLQNRQTLTIARTLQTVGPAPLTVADARSERSSALGGLRLGGRYRLEGLIAEGATSWVYRGRHVVIDQGVAVKVLRPEFCANKDAVERFLDEARTLARLCHPNIVTVHDFDRSDERAWMVMELLEGETLAERRERLGRLRWTSVRRIVLQLCSALRTAHDHGILHRDIKPENCVCLPNAADREYIKIIDFGIASLRIGDHVASLEPRGCIAGTPAYMAPERLLGRGDERSDIFSTGVVMYELLTGTLPFEGFFPSQRRGVVEPPSERTPSCCSRDVDQIVLRAMAYDPAERFQSMRELAAAIRRTTEADTGTIVLSDPVPPVRRVVPRASAKRVAPPPAPAPSLFREEVSLVAALPPPPLPAPLREEVSLVAAPMIAAELEQARPRRARSRVPGLLSVTAALALALGLSPLGTFWESHALSEPVQRVAPSEFQRPSNSKTLVSHPVVERPFPAALARTGHHPWRSECIRLAGR